MLVCLCVFAAGLESGRYIDLRIAAPSEDFPFLFSDELPRKKQLVVSFLQALRQLKRKVTQTPVLLGYASAGYSRYPDADAPASLLGLEM